MKKKGGELLMTKWRPCDIELRLLSSTYKREVLELKAKASYFIDNIDEAYKGGPYGMNTVEAWLLGIPVFSLYSDMSLAVCPELTRLVHRVTLDTVQEAIENYVYDRIALQYCKQYAIDKHSSINIAKHYVLLHKGISSI